MLKHLCSVNNSWLQQQSSASLLKRSFSAAKVETSHKLKPLSGIRVLEMGQLIAGPFTTTLLGFYGAEILKIENVQHGDPVRNWRELDEDGTSPWWRSVARNKKSLTVDLKNPEGRKIVRKLADKCDVLVENFKPGVMEGWGLSPDEIKKTNPDLIYTRISGYGQDGPYASRAGYASVCEAMGGFRHINGFEGMPPVRPNISLGDSLAGLHAAFGVLLGLLAKNKLKQSGKPGGQVVDVAIYEAVYNMLESIVPEYDRLGKIRGPSGSTLTGIVPTNTYPCKDGKYVVIGGNGDSIFKRLMTAAGRPDIANDEKYSSNSKRVVYQKVIDDAIAKWTSSLHLEQVLEAMEKASVPAGAIYDVKDMFNDPHYNARNMFHTVNVNNKPLKVPAIVPKLTETPGETLWAGPELGEHNESALKEILNISTEEFNRLTDRKSVV